MKGVDMALPLDCLSTILCREDFRLVVEDDEVDEEVSSETQRKLQQNLFFDGPGFDHGVVSTLFEKEGEMVPRDDYLTRLQSGDLDVSARNDSVEWIYKVHRHYSFQPLTACLSVNYLDRFLSEYELPRGKPWMVQLLSVACLSLAAKMEETDIPLPLDLQVIEGKLVFEARTIQRMELLLLSVLKWRTNAVTPLSFIGYFFSRITNPESPNPKSLIFRSAELVLITTEGIEFLEFRPSEIALAVAISVIGETQTIDFNSAFDSCSSAHLNKERVLNCYELVQEIINSTIINSTGRGVCLGCDSSNQCVCVAPPMSPSGVLDAAALLSYNSSNGMMSGSVSSMSSDGGESGSAPKRRRLIY